MIRPTSYWRNDKWRNGCETRTGLKKSILIIPCPLQNLKCIHSHLISSRYCLGKWKDSKNSVSTKTTCTATYSRTLPFWSIPSDMTSRTSLKLSITLWHSASDAAAITALLWLNVSPWAIPSDCYSAGESDFWREHWSSTPWHRTCFQVLHIQHHSKQPWYEFQPADESSTVLQPLFIVKQLLFTSAIQTKITLSTSQGFLPFSLFLGSSTAPQNLTPNLLVVLTTHCIMCLYTTPCTSPAFCPSEVFTVPADAAYLGNLSSGKGFWFGFSEEKNKQGKKKKQQQQTHSIKSVALLVRQTNVLGCFVCKCSVSFQIRMQNFQHSLSECRGRTTPRTPVEPFRSQHGVPTIPHTAPVNLCPLPCPHRLLAVNHQVTSPSVSPAPKVSLF